MDKIKTKGIFFLSVLPIFLTFYYFSPWSIYFWNPSLDFLLHIFWFPFYFLPELFLTGGYFPGLPNPITIIPGVILMLVLFYKLSGILYYIVDKLNIRYKFVVSLIIILILAILGGIGEQKLCEYNLGYTQDSNDSNRILSTSDGKQITIPVYGNKEILKSTTLGISTDPDILKEEFDNKSGEKYLKNTGVILFEFHDSFLVTKKKLNVLYKLVGIKYLEGPDFSNRMIASVKPGEEFNKLCKLKVYNQIDKSVPITETELFSMDSSRYWKYIDPNFCETNQLISHTEEQCLMSIKNHRRYIVDPKTGFIQQDASSVKFFDSYFVSFNYSSVYKLYEQAKDEVSMSLYLIQDPFQAVISLTKFNDSSSIEAVVKNRPPNTQLIKIGKYEFYKRKEKKESNESVHYETVANNISILRVEATYPDYESYEKEIEKIIETINVK